MFNKLWQFQIEGSIINITDERPKQEESIFIFCWSKIFENELPTHWIYSILIKFNIT